MSVVRRVSVLVVVVAMLSATGLWWLEYMAVHDSWGDPTRDDDDLLAQLVAMKTEPR